MAPVSTGYTRTQIILHWAIALLVIFQYAAHDPIHELVDELGLAAASAETIPLLARAHVMAGILTFALMLIRVFMRLTKGAPALPKEENPILKMAAHATHGILYLALLLMPISGAAAWFGQVEMAANVHVALKFVLVAFVALHVAGALYHQFVLKNGLIKRMMKAG